MRYVLLLFVLWTAAASGQSWETIVTQAPAGFNAYHIIEDRDGNFAVAGVYAISIGHSVFFLVKLDANGNYIDHRIYHQSSPAPKTLGGIIEIPNSGYLLYGWKAVDGANQYDYFTLRTNYNGDTLWSKAWGTVAADEGLLRCVYSDGFLYFLGHSDDVTCTGPAEGNIRLIKTDTLCNTLWERCYKYGYNGTTARGLAMCADGKLVIAGTHMILGGGNPFLLKLNTDGDTLFYRRYLLDSSGQGWGVACDSLNNLYLSGSTGSLNPAYPFDVDAFILKTDSLGEEIWKKIEGHQPGQDFFIGLQVKENSLYGFGGWCTGGTGCFGLVGRYDLNGSYLWGRVIDRSQTFWRDGIATNDGGVAATGLTETGGMAYAIKIDSFGNVPLGYTEPFTVIQSITRESSFEVFPNPTSGEVTVRLNDGLAVSRECAIVVTDVLGRVVMKRMIDPSQTRITLSLSDLSDGCYLLHVAGNGLSNKSVMIMLKR